MDINSKSPTFNLHLFIPQTPIIDYRTDTVHECWATAVSAHLHRLTVYSGQMSMQTVASLVSSAVVRMAKVLGNPL